MTMQEYAGSPYRKGLPCVRRVYPRKGEYCDYEVFSESEWQFLCHHSGVPYDLCVGRIGDALVAMGLPRAFVLVERDGSYSIANPPTGGYGKSVFVRKPMRLW